PGSRPCRRRAPFDALLHLPGGEHRCQRGAYHDVADDGELFKLAVGRHRDNRPAITEATPPETCWIAAPITLNDPRLAISGTEVDIAWNGMIREKIPTNSTTLT